jgi:replicative DNA helicase
MAEQKIFAVAEGRENKGFTHIRDALVQVYDRLHLLAENKTEALGMPTGFSGLDRVLVGLGKSDLVLVGARPGMGKTSFAVNLATYAATTTKKSVCIFSLEMSAEQLITRVMSSEALIDSYRLRSGELNDEDWDKLAHAASRLSECEILIDDTTGITVTGMKAKLRRVKNLGMVVIDYLQLMQSDRRIDNRVQEVAEISRGLKLLAKELQVPVICCAQLSRGPESRTDKRPMLSDLRDSGAIEQDADIVLFLYRDEYYKTEKDEPQNVAEVIVAKNRHGSTGNVKMGWFGQYTKFTTLEEDRQE